MNRKYMPRRRLEGYYEGASGRRSQFEFDGPEYGRQGGSFHSFGDDARWKNDTRAKHHNMDHFGQGHQERSWNKNLDNRDDYPEGQYFRGHFGKGPKGYQRSRERIFEDVCEGLTLHPEVDASEIDINVEEGIVTLSGTVESRSMKRMAEIVTEGVPGVDDVVNLLRPIGTPRADQMHTTGSALGGNPEQESKTGNRH
jgi:hypothetical protein